LEIEAFYPERKLKFIWVFTADFKNLETKTFILVHLENTKF